MFTILFMWFFILWNWASLCFKMLDRRKVIIDHDKCLPPEMGRRRENLFTNRLVFLVFSMFSVLKIIILQTNNIEILKMLGNFTFQFPLLFNPMKSMVWLMVAVIFNSFIIITISEVLNRHFSWYSKWLESPVWLHPWVSDSRMSSK